MSIHTGMCFDDERPDLNDYLQSYEEKAKVMDELAHALMNLAFPGAPEQGIITEEEFAAKKRQLLGI